VDLLHSVHCAISLRAASRLEEERLLFPLVWLVSVLVFFAASLGKRGVYILPLYPAFALLFGAWWQQLEQAKPVLKRHIHIAWRGL